MSTRNCPLFQNEVVQEANDKSNISTPNKTKQPPKTQKHRFHFVP